MPPVQQQQGHGGDSHGHGHGHGRQNVLGGNVQEEKA